ncbi:aryl-alcohol oxidase-like protein, partial [Rhizodiscina lignyota]
YDFVIVGGGTAGCALAARLAEDGSFRVLLIEAGSKGDDVTDIRKPFMWPFLSGSKVDWNYKTVAQKGLNNRVIACPRGFVLGGCSAINALTYNRASNDFYDKWAEDVEDGGWSWKSMEHYYRKVLSLVPPADEHDTTGQVDPALYGNGPIQLSINTSYSKDIHSRTMESVDSLGGQFFTNLDLQGGRTLGFSWLVSTVAGGERSYTTRYLDTMENGKNLDILINTRVTRILPVPGSLGAPDMRTVEIASSREGSPRSTITARKEVILAAGSINSPQILQLSGIGSKKILEPLGIDVHLDIQDVGLNLRDHATIATYFSTTSQATWDGIVRDHSELGKFATQWDNSRNGLFADPPASGLGYIRLPDDDPVLKKVGDPSSGPSAAHIEYAFGASTYSSVACALKANQEQNGFIPLSTEPPPTSGNYITALVVSTSPTSAGSVQINSSDAFDAPLIDFAILTTEFDQHTIVEGMKSAVKLFAAAPLKEINTKPCGTFAAALETGSDDALLNYARDIGITMFHASCTTAMSPVSASWGVVNPDLTVKGAQGLRIVDAGVFPRIPECHPTGVIYALAERAADIIKTKYSAALSES